MEKPDHGAVKSRLAHTKCAVHTPTMFGTEQTHALSKRKLMWIILLFLFLFLKFVFIGVLSLKSVANVDCIVQFRRMSK